MQPTSDGPFPYSPIKARPAIQWPGGARIALMVVPNVEHFPLDVALPGPNNERPTGSERLPMVREWSQRDYGNRVGVFRLMEVLERHGIRGTVALNSFMCTHRPQVVEEMRRLGWEFMGHNETNAVRLNQIPVEAEEALIRRVLDTIADTTGTRPVGWLSSGNAETWNTLEHLVANGVRYVCDWVNDDQPYPITVNGREIVAVPYTADINDIDAFWRQKRSAPEFERMICDHFDVVYREGGRVMTISLHPFVIGQPHRIGALERALAHIGCHPGVWRATGSEILEHVLKRPGL